MFPVSLLCACLILFVSFFFFNDTATTEIYTLSLHDALPISCFMAGLQTDRAGRQPTVTANAAFARSEEHTSELQSPCNLVCRLLLEKKKKMNTQKMMSNKEICTMYVHL